MRNLTRALVFFNVAIYCSHAYVYFFDEGITSFKPVFWYLFTVTLGLALALQRLSSVLPELSRPFIVWLWVYLCDNIVGFLCSSQSELAVQTLITNVEEIALLFSFLVIFLQEGGIRTARVALLLLVPLGVYLNIADFFHPTLNSMSDRAAGLYENPNVSGYVLAFMMLGSIPLVPRKLRFLYCIVVGLGILVTFSRSAWLMWGIAVTGLAGAGQLAFKRKGLATVFISLAAGFLLYSLLTGGVYDLFKAAGLEEYLSTNTEARLGHGEEMFTDYSSRARAEILRRSWQAFQEHPLLGGGLGFTNNQFLGGAHNMYIRAAAESGVLGLGVFIGLLVVLWCGADDTGRVLVAIYAVSSLSSHNNLDDPAILAILALLAAAGRVPEGRSELTSLASPARSTARANLDHVRGTPRHAV